MPAPRLTVALTVCALVAVVFTGLSARTLKPGSTAARWPIKTSVPAGASLNSPKDVPIATLIGLGDVPGVVAQDPRYTSKRIPDAISGLHEGDIVRTKGYVHVVALESDGDYHIQVTGSKTSGNQCLIVELPMDKAHFESDPTLRALSATLRPFLRTKLLHGTAAEFSEGGNWMVGQVYMSISGQLFFDDWHVGQPPRGKSPNGHAGHAATLWEIHPVTDIRFTSAP
jgi:hypothetical protein